MNHDQIAAWLDHDDVVKPKVVVKKKVRKKHKHVLRNCVLLLGSFLGGFCLIGLYFVPLGSKSQEFDVKTSVVDDFYVSVNDPVNASNLSNAAFIVGEHFVPPENSFGIGEFDFITLNYSHFWHLFRTNSKWQLQAQHPVSGEWLSEYQGTNLNNWLDIERTRLPNNLSEKINLTVTNNGPVPLRFRFVFGIDARVKQYINKTSNFEYVLTYPANETEDYTVFFNWNDIRPLLEREIITVDHGIRKYEGKDYFYFKIAQTEGSTLNVGQSYTIDPEFGYQGTMTGNTSFENGIRGMHVTTGDLEGVADTIKAYLSQGGNYNDKIKCAIYDYVDYSSVYAGSLVGVTGEETHNIGAGNWYTYTFSEPKPELQENTDYYLTIWAADDMLGTVYLGYNSGGDNATIQSLTYTGNYPDPLTGESSASYSYLMYCSYTAQDVNDHPSIDSNSIDTGDYNLSLNQIFSVTITENEGENCAVDWYISTDNSTWNHFQKNATVTANTSTSANLSSLLTDYQTTYYLLVTANDTSDNTTGYYSFETTPYRTLYFNDTFPNENYVESYSNMTIEDSYANSTEAAASSTIEEDFEDALNEDVWGTYHSNEAYYRNEISSVLKHNDSNSWRMDVTSDGNNNLNEIYTKFDFTGATEINVVFWSRDTGDEETDPGSSYSGVHGNYDGVYFSLNNDTFYELVSAATLNSVGGSVWGHTSVNVHDHGSFSGPVNDTFSIKFQQYDNYAYSSDGRWWDDIIITHNKPAPSIINSSIRSINLSCPNGYVWNTFNADWNLSGNETYCILDANNTILQSGLTGSNDDISGVTDRIIRWNGSFNALGALDSVNITWAVSGEPPEEEANWELIDNSINGTIYNTSDINWNLIDNSINGSIFNLSDINWELIDNAINGTIYNISDINWNSIDDSINGSIYNVSNWNVIDDTINGSIYNVSEFGWNLIDNTINGSIYNISDINWNLIDNNVNGSIYNLSEWCIIDDTINGSIYNLSDINWNLIDNTINGSIYNYTPPSVDWNLVDNSINGSIFNWTTWDLIDNSINGTIYNVSPAQPITITDEYPSNNSNNIPLQPWSFITINSSNGQNMNITWYLSGILIGTTSNVSNGTYITPNVFHLANTRSTNYSWYVNVDDGINNIIESYSFNTEGFPGGGGLGGDDVAFGIAAGALLLASFAFILMLKRRRKNLE